MNVTHLMIIGFGAILLLLGVLAPQGGWNIYVMILGFLHIVVGNVLVFRQMQKNFRDNAKVAAQAQSRATEQE
ncbi:MAG: hypothetical protein Q4A03_00280 [Rothia sp. (in: high G+C Gram-positive bacteria)]|uniref:hypothetical protein n=1 Tax=Rothia sp. (in: high G+C Gram-positive bacteria) TaxID=1885016 RepID=UPI0027028032|nr:hypothetical protein [Rothia sp. (in: high G+C Gram-positive bacteria)]